MTSQKIDPDDAAPDHAEEAAPALLRGGGTLTEQACDAIRTDITSGALKPERRLRIEALSQRYGVGPTPLREALQRLCAEGLVVSTGGRGFSVAPLSVAEFEDLTIARIAIEQQALRLAIAKGGDEWEAQVVAAAWRLRKRDEALAEGGEDTLPEWAAANAAFHAATVAACGSRWLLRMRGRLNMQAERYRLASIALQRADRDLMTEHQAIADAVLARDADAACALIERHFDATARHLRDRLAAQAIC